MPNERAGGGAGVGNGASSETLSVGATRGASGESRAPHPPQNRESGVFSVPQLGQRIPANSVTHRAFRRLIALPDPTEPL